MIQPRNTIKSNFQTGDYPNQQQFWDWIDSFLHLTEDKIEIENVRNLLTALNNKADYETMQQLYYLYLQLPNIYAEKNHVHTFASLTDKPNTIGGYGIDDAFTKNESIGRFSPLKHDHIADDIFDFTPAVEGIINPLRNANNGIAALDSNGKLSNAVLPTLSTTEVYTAVSQAAMLTLDAQRGDFAIRTDTTPATVYILAGNNPSVLSDWTKISTAGGVLTVNGKSGPSVQLTTTDIDEGTRKYYTDALARAAITAGGPIIFNQSTGVISHAATTGYNLNWDAAGTNKVIGRLNFNATGHITDWGERSLTPDDINAAPSSGSPRYVQISPTQAQSGDYWLSGSGKLGGGINAGGNSSIGGNLLISGAVTGNSSATFTGNVSGADATAPTHFVTFQQFNALYTEGAWTPAISAEILTHIGTVTGYYSKVGKSVKVVLQMEILSTASTLPGYLIQFGGLPFNVRPFGIQNMTGYYGTSFADSGSNPSTAYQRLNLRIMQYNGSGYCMTASEERFRDIAGKVLVLDITYISTT